MSEYQFKWVKINWIMNEYQLKGIKISLFMNIS